MRVDRTALCDDSVFQAGQPADVPIKRGQAVNGLALGGGETCTGFTVFLPLSPHLMLSVREIYALLTAVNL